MSAPAAKTPVYTMGRSDSETRRLLLQAPLGGGDGWAGIPWVVETWRSILPLLEQYEIVTAADLGLETLGDRVYDEAEQLSIPFMLIPVVTAWANKPID